MRTGAYRDHVNRCCDIFEDPHGEFPNTFSVPFPSSVHARDSDTGPFTRFPWDNGQPRRLSASFVGTTHGDVHVRHRLQSQCELMGSRCDFRGFAYGSSLRLKHESDFCLEAAGHTPFRKSLADSVGMGCIPMLFHPMTDNANDLLWADWKEAARVVVPRDKFISGQIDLPCLIDSVPQDLLSLMKQTLSKNARSFQISMHDDDADQVHRILVGLMVEARRRKSPPVV